jgi:sulfite exporter TauE/SafE
MFIKYITIGLAGGVLAFVHCLGMCGGFCLHLSRTGRSSQVLFRQLLWHAGKTSTYVFLGALAGFCGGMIHSQPWIPNAQNTLAYLAGAIMILTGLFLLGLPTPFLHRISKHDDSLLASVFRNFLKEPAPSGALALGIATGFLPCPIVLAFLAYSAHTGSVAAGMTVMAALGIGTIWSLLLLGMTGHVISNWLRRWGAVTAGVVLVVLGITTILRGTEVLHRMLGCRCPSEVRHTDAAQPKQKTCPCCECESESRKPPQPER